MEMFKGVWESFQSCSNKFWIISNKRNQSVLPNFGGREHAHPSKFMKFPTTAPKINLHNRWGEWALTAFVEFKIGILGMLWGSCEPCTKSLDGMEGALGGKFVLDFQISNVNRLHLAAHRLLHSDGRWECVLASGLSWKLCDSTDVEL